MENIELWMQHCLHLAANAKKQNEVPVGAAIIKEGLVIAEAHNWKESHHSPSAHAELLAIEGAARHLGRWRLNDCILVTTLEPCVMCAGALIQARIDTLIFGAFDPKGGAESVFGLLSSPKHNHRAHVVSGVLENECSELLKEFFKEKRQGNKI